jgi:hypothetical protein
VAGECLKNVPDLQKELVVDDLRIHNQTYYHYPGQIWNPV